jgi:acyl-CoA thioesterase FadM
MRLLILLHQNDICQPGPRDIQFTLNMNVAYSAPVFTTSNVLVRSRLIRCEGRKWFTRAEITNGAGTILTSAKSTWVTARKAIKH